MGASASTNVNTIRNNLQTSAIQGCPATTASNTINLSGLNYTEPAWCPANSPGINIQQVSEIDAQCFLGNLQSSVAQSVAQMDATAQAGLGLSASTNKSDIQNQISQKTTQTCAGQSTSNAVIGPGAVVSACQLQIFQNANDNNICQINATQNLADQVAVKQAAMAKGGSFFGDIFGSGILSTIFIIIIVLIVLGIIGGIITAVVKNRGSTTNTSTTSTAIKTGGADGFNLQNNKSLLVIIILIVLLIVAIIFNSSPTKTPINEQDIENLKQTINEAQRIAGIDASTPVTPEYTDEIIGDAVYYIPQYDDNFADIDDGNLDDFYKPLLEN